MVYVGDTQQLLTITLLVEGIGTIISFTAVPTSGYAGDTITLAWTIENTGPQTDTLFTRIIDDGTGVPLMTEQEYAGVVPGPAGQVSGNLITTIPVGQTGNWILRLEAGHIE